jgi:hypothetical protein
MLSEKRVGKILIDSNWVIYRVAFSLYSDSQGF